MLSLQKLRNVKEKEKKSFIACVILLSRKVGTSFEVRRISKSNFTHLAIRLNLISAIFLRHKKTNSTNEKSAMKFNSICLLLLDDEGKTEKTSVSNQTFKQFSFFSHHHAPPKKNYCFYCVFQPSELCCGRSSASVNIWLLLFFNFANSLRFHCGGGVFFMFCCVSRRSDENSRVHKQR